MKTITLLSVAIATSLATHLALATPAASDLPPGDCLTGLPAPGGMLPGNKGPGKKLPTAKRQAKVAEIMAEFDTNQDGQITQDEVRAKQAEKFKEHAEHDLAKFDVNQDGQITLDEVQAIHAARFKIIDTDGNGFLSFEEFEKGAPRPPKPLMEDDDGPDDMQGPPPRGPEEAPAAMSGQRKGSKGKPQPGAGGSNCLPPPANQAAGKDVKKQRRQEHFKHLDHDGDGQLSEAEFMADLPVFDKFDCDDNGVITKDDLLQGPCRVPATAPGNGQTLASATPPLPLFDRFDCNQDGVITTEELQQGPCQTEQPAIETTVTTDK